MVDKTRACSCDTYAPPPRPQTITNATHAALQLAIINLFALVASVAPLSARTTDSTVLLRRDFIYPPDTAAYTPLEKGYSAGVDIGHEIYNGNIIGAVEPASSPTLMAP
ncbi:hypothetical protein BOTBODRAFT_32253 [Botryobasidium botryosum FD-172 SS1]|uniref:Uncharacterized protein n=1 Tax=Botryobasidium botryosum (strain FD-172 SS1) TaxID=930990 RepID=A0A067MTL2_BOTB1|nr:hypothetical protein BOTBODRAFT_32253 [Botryobasidium botryosum FD-172 SS1]